MSAFYDASEVYALEMWSSLVTMSAPDENKGGDFSNLQTTVYEALNNLFGLPKGKQLLYKIYGSVIWSWITGLLCYRLKSTIFVISVTDRIGCICAHA